MKKNRSFAFFVVIVIGIAVSPGFSQETKASNSTEPDASQKPEVLRYKFRPDYVPPVSFTEAVNLLTDKDVKSSFDRNDNLAKEVDNRSVGFPLTQRVRGILIHNGASQGLLTSIERCSDKRAEKIEKLNKEFREIWNYKDTPSIRRSLEISEELLETIGDRAFLVGEEKELAEFVIWLEDFSRRRAKTLAAVVKQGTQ